MTGFGSTEASVGGDRITVTAQSWNHRGADLVFRLPERFRSLESRLREAMAGRIRRGRLEVSVRAENGPSAPQWRFDRAGLESLAPQLDALVAGGRVQESITLGDLLRSPFVVREASPESAGDEHTDAGVGELLRAVECAADQLVESRRAEGERLAAALRSSSGQLAGLAERIAERRAQIGAELRESLRRKLDLLLPGGVDAIPEERLAQEIVLLAERSDVSEEIERLRGHLAAFTDALGGDEPAGKRLEFLIQEIQRELSTLGAKARDLETTNLVIDAKVVNEQMREQVQNVE